MLMHVCLLECGAIVVSVLDSDQEVQEVKSHWCQVVSFEQDAFTPYSIALQKLVIYRDFCSHKK